MNPTHHTCDCGYTWQHGRDGSHHCSEYYRKTIADLRAALAAKTEAPADPMDWPLPCDVTVGCGTHGKGTKLRGLVARMQRLYDAMRQCDDAEATPAMTVEPVACAWMIESNVAPSTRCATSLHLNEADADRFVNAEQARYAGANRTKTALGRIVPAVQQGGEAVPCDRDRDSVLEEAAKRLELLYPNEYARPGAIRAMKGKPAAAHPVMDGKSGDGIDHCLEESGYCSRCGKHCAADDYGDWCVIAATKGAENK